MGQNILTVNVLETGSPREASGAALRQVVADLGLPLTSGILLAISFMRPPLGLLAWIALVPFAVALARKRASLDLYVGAYLGGVVLHLHGLQFIRTRLTDAGFSGSNTLDWLLTGLLWASVWPATLYVGRRVLRALMVPMTIALPVVWVASEFLRQMLGSLLVSSPFPWLQLGITQADHLHLLQLADLGGVWTLAALVASVNGAVYDTLASRRIKPLVVASAIAGIGWLYGEARLHGTPMDAGPRIALMPVSSRPGGSLSPVKGADVAVWSETVQGISIDESASDSVETLESAARSARSTLVVGCIRTENDLQFNSAAVIDPNAGYLGCYDKQFLVPWIEYAPWKPFVRASANGEFTRGRSRPVFHVGRRLCGVTICYDAAFDRLFRGFSPKPDFFLACSRETSDPSGNVSRTLLMMTRLRAVENRRTIVRNVEGGFSGVVSSTGEFNEAPPQPWMDPVLTGPIPIDHRSTLSAFGGDWLPLVCCCLVTAAVVRAKKRE